MSATEYFEYYGPRKLEDYINIVKTIMVKKILTYAEFKIFSKKNENLLKFIQIC